MSDAHTPNSLEEFLSSSDDQVQEQLDEIMTEIQGLLQDTGNIDKIEFLTVDGPTSIKIEVDGQSIEIFPSGEIKFNPPCEPSEGAKAFWKAIGLYGSKKEEEYHDNWIKSDKLVRQLRDGIQERNDAISRLCAEIDNLKGNGPDKEPTDRFKAIAEEQDEDA